MEGLAEAQSRLVKNDTVTRVLGKRKWVPGGCLGAQVGTQHKKEGKKTRIEGTRVHCMDN